MRQDGKTPITKKPTEVGFFAFKWLGYEDSNLGMPESESGALPLGDTPTNCLRIYRCVSIRPEFGGYDGIRTCDPIIMSDVL